LETERGRNCALRKFLPDTVFWSAQFDMLAPESISSNSSAKVVTNGEANDVITTQEGDSWCKEIKVGYSYSFFFNRIAENHFMERNVCSCNYSIHDFGYKIRFSL